MIICDWGWGRGRAWRVDQWEAQGPAPVLRLPMGFQSVLQEAAEAPGGQRGQEEALAPAGGSLRAPPPGWVLRPGLGGLARLGLAPRSRRGSQGPRAGEGRPQLRQAVEWGQEAWQRSLGHAMGW